MIVRKMYIEYGLRIILSNASLNCILPFSFYPMVFMGNFTCSINVAMMGFDIITK